MKIICISNELTLEQKLKIGMSENRVAKYALTLNKIYTVLALTFQTSGYTGTTFQVLDDYERCIHAPMCLFEIIDDRISKFWLARKIDDFNLALWPEEFYQEYFHDDLSNDEPVVVEKFRKIFENTEHEFD